MTHLKCRIHYFREQREASSLPRAVWTSGQGEEVTSGGHKWPLMGQEYRLGQAAEQGSAIVLQEEHDGRVPGEMFLVLLHFLVVCG